MNDFSDATYARMQSEGGFSLRWFLWFVAKDRDTGAAVSTGLCSDARNVSLVIDTEQRLYYGAQGLFDVGPITYAMGTTIRKQQVNLGPITPEVKQLLRGYETRYAFAQLHARVKFQDGTTDIARKFEGQVDAAPITTPAKGGNGVAQLTLVSSLRKGTRTIHSHKSDEAQKKRQNDRFRKYGSIAGGVPVWWGEERDNVRAKRGIGRPGAIKRSTWN